MTGSGTYSTDRSGWNGDLGNEVKIIQCHRKITCQARLLGGLHVPTELHADHAGFHPILRDFI